MTTPRKLDPEVQEARDNLAASLDELLDRVHPRTVATDLASATKQAASDAASFVSGNGLPSHDEYPSRARNAKAALGIAVGGAALLVFSVLTKKKK